MSVLSSMATPMLSSATDTVVVGSDGIGQDGVFNVTGLEELAPWQCSLGNGLQLLPGSGSNFAVTEGSLTVLEIAQIELAGVHVGPYTSAAIEPSALVEFANITTGWSAVNWSTRYVASTGSSTALVKQADVAGNTLSSNEWIESSSTVVSTLTVGIHACSWKAHTLFSGVDISAAVVSFVTTNPMGVATIAQVAYSRLWHTASRVAPSTESSATDSAFNILKIIVCLHENVVGKVLSPYPTLGGGYTHTLGVCYFNDLHAAPGLSLSQFGY